jgi:AraC-like DNA-binding protein
MNVAERVAHQRSDAWRAEIRERFNAMRVAELADAPAQASAQCLSAGRVEIAEVVGTPQDVLRTRQAVREAPNDRLKVCIQLEGSALVCQDDREIDLKPGDLALYDLSRPYKMRLLSAWRVLIMTFPAEAVDLGKADLDALRTVPVPVRNGPGDVLVSHLGRSIAAGDACDLAAREYLGDAALCLLNATLAGQRGPAPSQHDDLHERVLTYIRHNLADPALNHDLVAAAHHVSARTLHKVFADRPRTVTQTIRALRLEAVRKDLANPSLAYKQVASIARAWCFADAPHFSRLFRATFGESPSRYRERVLGQAPGEK